LHVPNVPNYNKMSGMSSLLLQTNGFNHIFRDWCCIRNSSYVIFMMTLHLVSIESKVRQGARAGYLHWGI